MDAIRGAGWINALMDVISRGDWMDTLNRGG